MTAKDRRRFSSASRLGAGGQPMTSPVQPSSSPHPHPTTAPGRSSPSTVAGWDAEAMNLGVLENHPIVPVVVIDDADWAMALAEALCAGGIRCAEVTLRTSAALDAVASMRQIADFSVGVGTVLTANDVDRAADVGAEFVVSPGWDDRVVDRAREKGLTVLPGVATASEVMC